MPQYRNKIYKWQGDSSQPYPNNFTWESKEFLYPFAVTFTHARLFAETGDRNDYYQSILDRDQIIKRNSQRISGLTVHGAIGEDPIGFLAINDDLLEDVPVIPDYSGDFNLLINFYVDDTLHFTKQVYSINEPFKIEKGYRGRKFKIEIIGNVEVGPFKMATSIDELMQG